MDEASQTIESFDFAGIYESITARASDGATFVQVGAPLARSALYLASRIQASRKRICLYVVDPWRDTFQEFIDEVRHSGTEDVVFPLRMSSSEAAGLFEDGTLDFVFLNGDTQYESVRRDLDIWFPRIKRRGVLGGHPYLDANLPGMRRAADEYFTEQQLPLQLHGSSFVVIKPSPRWLNASLRSYRRIVPTP